MSGADRVSKSRRAGLTRRYGSADAGPSRRFVRVGPLAGFITSLAVILAQAEASLAQAQGTYVTQIGQLEISRAEYVRATGHPPGRLILPRERPALPATREEALSLAANNNFSVISATFAELAARDNIDVVRGQLLPQVSVVGTLVRSYDQASSFK